MQTDTQRRLILVLAFSGRSSAQVGFFLDKRPLRPGGAGCPQDVANQARRLTSGQADEDSPSSSADGHWLAYTDNRGNATAIVVRDLNTGDEKTLPVSHFDFGQPTGTVRFSVVEKGTHRTLVARVSVQQQGGKYFAPIGSRTGGGTKKSVVANGLLDRRS